MQEPSGRLGGQRILVVEDQLLIAMSIEGMLRTLECEVVGPAATVEQAVSAIGKHRLDGALLDVNLHGKTILPAAEALARHAVPFVLVTGYEPAPSDAPLLRDAPRLRKPFALDDLAEIMTRTFVKRAAPAGKRRRRVGPVSS